VRRSVARKAQTPCCDAPAFGRGACRIPLILQSTRRWPGAGFDFRVAKAGAAD
jgi:hypothetical protein